MQKIITILLSLLLISCDLATTRQEIMAAQKPLPYAYELRHKALETLAQRVKFSDKLYVVTQVQHGICGNDERFHSESFLSSEEVTRLKDYVKKNPYFLVSENSSDVMNSFPAQIRIGKKTVITGTSFEGKTFETVSKKLNLHDISEPVLFIDFVIIDGHTVDVVARDRKKEQPIKFTLERHHDSWKPKYSKRKLK